MEDEREKTENLSEASIYRAPIINQCATGSIDGLTIMATGSQLARVARRRALVWRRVPNEPGSPGDGL